MYARHNKYYAGLFDGSTAVIMNSMIALIKSVTLSFVYINRCIMIIHK